MYMFYSQILKFMGLTNHTQPFRALTLDSELFEPDLSEGMPDARYILLNYSIWNSNGWSVGTWIFLHLVFIELWVLFMFYLCQVTLNDMNYVTPHPTCHEGGQYERRLGRCFRDGLPIPNHVWDSPSDLAKGIVNPLILGSRSLIARGIWFCCFALIPFLHVLAG